VEGRVDVEEDRGREGREDWERRYDSEKLVNETPARWNSLQNK
jgi:hypothetical protein